MKATLVHNHLYTEDIILPDDVNTGVIISAIMDAFDRLHGQEEDVFQIALPADCNNGNNIFYCCGVDGEPNKWSLYVAYPVGTQWVADFLMNV